MGNREPDGGMSDATLEREIEQALSVEPSPEFVARLRAVVAADSMRAPWQWRWRWLAVGSAAIALTSVLVMTRSESLLRPTLPEPPRTQAAVPQAMPQAPEPPQPALRERPTRDRPAPIRRVSSAPTAEPEVLIAKDESAALRRLMRELRRGRVDPSTRDAPTLEPIAVPGTIVVMPIPAIAPIAIDPLELEGGARQ
jgi:hypothetical protein